MRGEPPHIIKFYPVYSPQRETSKKGAFVITVRPYYTKSDKNMKTEKSAKT